MRPGMTREDVQDAIIVALKKGNYREAAVTAAGISRQTFYRWMRLGQANLDAVARYEAAVAKGQDADPVELDEWGLFAQEVEAAEAFAEVKIVENVIDLANSRGKPEVLIKFLERRYPDRWGRRRVDIVRSTADVAAEQADKRKALRATLAERKAKVEEARTVH